MLLGLLSSLHGASSGCGCKKQPLDMEGSCEYVDSTVANSRQRVVLQLVWTRG